MLNIIYEITQEKWIYFVSTIAITILSIILVQKNEKLLQITLVI